MPQSTQWKAYVHGLVIYIEWSWFSYPSFKLIALSYWLILKIGTWKKNYSLTVWRASTFELQRYLHENYTCSSQRWHCSLEHEPQTLVVYHLHGQTDRFTVWANVKQISVLGNFVRDWRLPFAEIPTIYDKNCTTATGRRVNEKVSARALFSVHLFAVLCTKKTWNDQIQSFV